MRLTVREDEWDIAEYIFKRLKPKSRKLSRKDLKLWEAGAREYFNHKHPQLGMETDQYRSYIDGLVKGFLTYKRKTDELCPKDKRGFYEQWKMGSLHVHSFENISGKIYASAVGRYIGEGAECTLKLCEGRDGQLLTKRVFYEARAEPGTGSYFTTIHEKLASIFKQIEKPYYVYATTRAKRDRDDLLDSQYALIKNQNNILTPYACKVRSFVPYFDAIDLNEFLGVHQRQLDLLDYGSLLVMAHKIIACIYNRATSFGIVHCDVKPGNILIKTTKRAHEVSAEEMVLELIDFNEAVQLKGNKSIAHSWGGTEGYAAPEIKSNEAYITTDSYSVGVILERAFRHLNLPPAVSSLIAGLTDKCPIKRTPMQHALEQIEIALEEHKAIKKNKI